MTANALPQDVQLVFRVWLDGCLIGGKDTPPLLTFPVVEAGGADFFGRGSSSKAANAALAIAGST